MSELVQKSTIMKTIFHPSVKTLLVSVIAFLAISSCQVTGQGVKFYPNENKAYPFSAAVKAGDLVYISGTLGTDKDGKLDPDFKKQSVQVMENIRDRITKLGYTMKDIVKCTVMIKDMAKWSQFNEVYRTYFEADRFPARSAMGVSGLAMGADIEVEVILYVGVPGN